MKLKNKQQNRLENLMPDRGDNERFSEDGLLGFDKTPSRYIADETRNPNRGLIVPRHRLEDGEAATRMEANREPAQPSAQLGKAINLEALVVEKSSEKQVAAPDSKVNILSKSDLEFLKKLEVQVDGSYLNSCEALLEIDQYEDGRLWRASGGFKQFTDYVKARFSFTKKHCNLLIRSARFIRKLKSGEGGVAIPVRESHIRPIIQKFTSKEEQFEFWNEFCRTHGITPETVGDLKASKIRSAVEEFRGEDPDQVADGEEDQKKATRKGNQLIKKLKKETEHHPKHEEISKKIEEIEALLNSDAD